MSTEPTVEPISEDEPDSDAEEVQPDEDVDEEEATIAANIVAGKEFPLANRYLDVRGFRNNAFLESVLSEPHEVCLLLQKEEGMSLGTAWQLIKVLHMSATSQRIPVVSGTTKEGVWTDMHAGCLTEMFKKFRTIFAEQLDQRFHVTTTPDKYTLLSLALDPSVSTSGGDSIFKDRSAAQQLLEGEHQRALQRRQLWLSARSSGSPPSSSRRVCAHHCRQSFWFGRAPTDARPQRLICHCLGCIVRLRLDRLRLVRLRLARLRLVVSLQRAGCFGLAARPLRWKAPWRAQCFGWGQASKEGDKQLSQLHAE